MGSEADATSDSFTPRALETRERILDAAEVVFSKQGFDNATTREIAALCKLNVATPYSYFASKEALYAAVIERAIAPLIELMDRFALESDKPGAAAETIHEVLSRLASHEATIRLLYREVVANGPLAEMLTTSLFEPLIQRVCAELRGAGQLDESMEPFMASMFVHLSFGHVAMAPLLSRLFGTDMLSPENIERQVRMVATAGGLGFEKPDR